MSKRMILVFPILFFLFVGATYYSANNDLSNLSSTAVNTHIIPDSANDTNLGSDTYPWDDIYFTQGIVKGNNDAFIDLYRGVAASEQQIRFYNEGDSMVQAIGVTNNGTDLFFWNGATRFKITNAGSSSFQDNDIDDVGDIALDTISSDAGTSVQVTLGTDSGDDFKVYNGSNTLFQVYGDTGIVDVGKQSGCGVYISGDDQTIAHNTMTKVILSDEFFDTQNEFDSTTNYRFTATKAGVYFITGRIRWASDLGGSRGDILIYKNGTGLHRNTAYPNGDTLYSMIGVYVLSLEANDYVELYVNQLTGGGVDITSNSVYGSYLSVMKIR